MLQITIISDCKDPNARARQEIFYRALLGNVHITFIGVEHELEASGCLIDAIDAYKGTKGIIIVNVAPRGNKEKYPNGVPFCFADFQNLKIIGTPNCFSLAKKFELISHAFETDVETVCQKFLTKDESTRIAKSQFRSYEYLPHLAHWLSKGEEIPSNKIEIPDFGNQNYIWYVDCFGNCKTTRIHDNLKASQRPFLRFKFKDTLADVPNDGMFYYIKGSSGYADKRFFEIVIQKGSAAKIMNKKVGDKI